MYIKRYIVVLETEFDYEILPLNSTENLSKLYVKKEDANRKLAEIYHHLRKTSCDSVRYNSDKGFFTVFCAGVPIVGLIKEVEIQLTGQEVFETASEYLDGCKEEDCINAIYRFTGYDPDAGDTEENLQAIKNFFAKYHRNVCDMAKGSAEATVLRHKIIAKYDRIFDANIDENSLWEQAVKLVLDEEAPFVRKEERL